MCIHLHEDFFNWLVQFKPVVFKGQVQGRESEVWGGSSYMQSLDGAPNPGTVKGLALHKCGDGGGGLG